MLKKNSNYRVLIAGDANIHMDTTYTKDIDSFIKDNDLYKNVIMAGFIEDMGVFYNALDLFLLPSFREPFGRVLIEAMATEKPVIASRVGGVPEVVDHEINGCLINPHDADNWRQCIDKLINNKSLRVQLGKAGRIKVLEKFTSEQVTLQIVAIYRDLIHVE